MIRNLIDVPSIMLWTQVFIFRRFELQMDMPMHMFDMWVWLLLFAVLLTLGVIVSMRLLTRPSQRTTPAAPPPTPLERSHATALTQEAEKTVTKTNYLKEALELVRPTLTEDERLIMNEIVKAGGEILQSDLPEKSDYSKATVSKLVRSLETMGVVTREKHKWTYWVRISDKLISRAKNT